MGVTFSNENKQINKDILRLPLDIIIILINNYSHHLFIPITIKSELQSLFYNALLKTNIDVNELIFTIWNIFSVDEICSLQEILVCLALLTDADWRVRLGLIYDIFKSPCTSDVNKEDIMLAVEVTMDGLKKLWEVNDSLTMSSMELAARREDLQSIAESIAGSIYIKLGKEMEDGILKEEFIKWGSERFKSSKTIASVSALYQIYSVG